MSTALPAASVAHAAMLADHMMRLRTKICLLFAASSLVAQGAQVISQRCAVSTYAEIWPSPMTSILARDADSLENQVIGDQTLACSSQTNFQTLSLFAGSDLMFRRTNILGSEVFWIESDCSMQSGGDLLTVNTSLVTKASASASVSFQLQSDTPFRYSIVTSGQSPPVLPNWGTITIRNASSHPILEMDWDSTMGNLPQGQGSLPAGVYQVEFWHIAQAEGDISPTMQNPISGTAGTVLSLTVTPEASTPTPPPVLHLRRGSGDVLLLKMTGLQPGTFYFIERSEEFVPGLSPVVANFIAGGTNAVWADNIYRNVQKMFYRLRY